MKRVIQLSVIVVVLVLGGPIAHAKQPVGDPMPLPVESSVTPAKVKMSVIGQNDYDYLSDGVVGDFTGDGVKDLAVCHKSMDRPSEPDCVPDDPNDPNACDGSTIAGGIAIFSQGLSGRHSVEEADIVIYGDPGHELFGYPCTAMDLNGDGIIDLEVSNGQYSSVDIIFGSPTLSTFDQASIADLLAADADANGNRPALRITPSITQPYGGGRFGYAIAGLGDVNRDGYGDLAIGVPASDLGMDDENGNGTADAEENPSDDIVQVEDSGMVFVLLGSKDLPQHKDGSIMDYGTLRVYSREADRALGYSIAGTGDGNGDGIHDFIVSAEDKVYFVFGAFDMASDIDVATLPVFSEEQANTIDRWTTVSGAADVNHDGYNDFLIGTTSYDHDLDQDGELEYEVGVAYLILGSSAPPSSSLSQMTKYIGAAESDAAGISVSGMGDYNRDGYADFLIGASWNDAGGTDAGIVYIVYGKGVPPSSPVQLGNSSVQNTYEAIRGTQSGANFGGVVRGVGDLDKNQTADYLIGASQYNAAGKINNGIVYLRGKKWSPSGLKPGVPGRNTERPGFTAP